MDRLPRVEREAPGGLQWDWTARDSLVDGPNWMAPVLSEPQH